MMPKIKAVLFDIGGVILRTDDPHPRQRLAARFGLDRAELDRLVFGCEPAQAAELGKGEEYKIWEYVARELRLSAEDLSGFQREFWAGDAVDLSLFELLRVLRREVSTALLTNSWFKDPLALFWTRYEVPEGLVRSAVDQAISSAAVGVQKPDPRIYQAALASLGVQPQEAVLVDDFANNIEASRRLGMRAILFESPTQARRDLLTLLNA